MNKLSTGSGLIRTIYDYENKKITMDFSGNGELNMCFRNDASILFYAANSYYTSYISLSKEIKIGFVNGKIKKVEHLILPYLFNFRHFVELELKAIYAALTDYSPELTHDIDKLLDQTEQAIKERKYDDINIRFNQITEDGFNNSKNEALLIFQDLKSFVHQYTSTESAVEYYRYIFENNKKELVLNNPVIDLDYNNTEKLFKNIYDTFNSLLIKLIEFVYIQFRF